MNVLNEIAETVKALIIEEWRKQGHSLTGAFEEKIFYEIKEDSGVEIVIKDGTERHYGTILNYGVPASLIPFSPGSGKKESKYIAALFEYAKSRMEASDEDALRIAFAIAYTHKREGMPSKGSEKYSKTGKRTAFTVDATNEIIKIVAEKYIKTIKEIIYGSISDIGA